MGTPVILALDQYRFIRCGPGAHSKHSKDGTCLWRRQSRYRARHVLCIFVQPSERPGWYEGRYRPRAHWVSRSSEI